MGTSKSCAQRFMIIVTLLYIYSKVTMIMNLCAQDICAGGKIEKNEVGGACGAHGGGERCAQVSSGETRGKEAIEETQT